MDPLNIFIVGPTASGKTDLAIALARALDGEIISADSRQIYRDLDAGTAKPPLKDGRADGVPCHLIGFLDPASPFDAGSFARKAHEAAAEIRGRGKKVIVAGGTGLYIKALLRGLSALPPRDPVLRARLTDEAERDGRPALHERLRRVDPLAAGAIPANNIQRLVRALEVHELTGRPISELWREKPRTPPLEGQARILSIEWAVPQLAARIEGRARAMWPAMLAEARRLVPSRYSGREPGFQSLGYREALDCAGGKLSESAGLEKLIHSTLLYAKRQRTWFRGQLPESARVVGGSLDAMTRSALSLIKRA